MSPEERAERLQQMLQPHIVPLEGDGTGQYWALTAKGRERIAAVIRLKQMRWSTRPSFAM